MTVSAHVMLSKVALRPPRPQHSSKSRSMADPFWPGTRGDDISAGCTVDACDKAFTRAARDRSVSFQGLTRRGWRDDDDDSRGVSFLYSPQRSLRLFGGSKEGLLVRSQEGWLLLSLSL